MVVGVACNNKPFSRTCMYSVYDLRRNVYDHFGDARLIDVLMRGQEGTV